MTTQDFNENEWLDRIEEDYGVRLGPGQLYADLRNHYVYAGSEYVATLGRTNSPADARDWTGTIAHFPRGLRRLDVAERKS